ncbi:hypothetical protein GDO86_013682 [Hymenochirus boettgeri]|uniref:Potassium channel domain-containing protein n=1 Tax=Hymenochirus boettgeri TaxID=247094 RepID=A0A8T2IXS3_9PIPI|nr:hypothetical protein GDO86_013682 [Hymenochirus boettgeri]
MSKDSPTPQQKPCWKCIQAFWISFPHVCLVCSVVLYSVIGAGVFHYIEGSREMEITELKEFLDKLWIIALNSSTNNMTIMGNESAFKEMAKEALVQDIKPEWKQKPEEQWSFMSSLFFCCTVFTTVGYGHIYPVTIYGKIACMVYATVGIPLMLLLLADFGDILAGLLSRTYRRAALACNRQWNKSTFYGQTGKSSLTSAKSNLTSTTDSQVSMREPLNITDVIKTQASVKRKYLKMRNIDLFELIVIKENQKVLPMKGGKFQRSHSCPDLDLVSRIDCVMYKFGKIGEELDRLDVPITLIVLIMVIYIMCGAFILPIWEEDWSTMDAFYFCFVTLTTIGFGDIIPKHPNYFLLLFVYTTVGMAIVCMAFKLGQNRLVSFYKQCITCISRGKVTKYSGDN